jgi:hypothetical protein
MVIGLYGGNSRAGARKNEDGALVWCPADGGWEFAVLLDAHFSVDSAKLVVDAVQAERDAITSMLVRPIDTAFEALHRHLLALFRSPEFRERCAQAYGEASCLICARKSAFLWWLSVGDCVVYLLHPRLARLGQYALNQRSYFEWIGHDNTFDLPVPCYASGVRRLLPGYNMVVMATDGLLECGRRPFENPANLYEAFTRPQGGLVQAVHAVLSRVHQERGRDSATVIAWPVGIGADYDEYEHSIGAQDPTINHEHA